MGIVSQQLFRPMKAGYDYSLSACRIFAMMSIIACHLISRYHVGMFSEFFSIGVQMFFVISGILLAKHEIKDTKIWLKKKAVRLYIPLWIWAVFRLVTDLIFKPQNTTKDEITTFFVTLLNIQGIRRIIPAIKFYASPWFLTAVFACYLIFILYNKLQKKIPKITSVYGSLCIIAVCVLASFAGIKLIDNVFYFLIGYNLEKNHFFDDKKKSNFLTAFFLMAFFFVFRIILKKFFDDTKLYENLFVQVSRLILSVSLIIFIKSVCNISKEFSCKVLSNPIFRWLDAISLNVYIFQTFFISDEVFRFSTPVNLLIMFTGLFLTSTIVYIICENLRLKILKQTEDSK